MKLEAVFHRPMSEYCHGLDEKHIVYRLRSARDDLRRVTLAYGDTACRQTPILFTPVPMEKIASDKLFDYWQVIVESPYERVYYYFELFDGESSVLYYGDVFSHQHVDDRSQYFKLPFNHRADLAKVPAWVEDAVVYNIFPDSFATGKGYLSCRATQQDYAGQSVHGKLGGTLRGVTENIDYLLELGINCVYLNPIFAAGEYHKYDLLDYYHVDPVFGGDEAFREMVQTLHAKGIRVIVDGVFNHCGWHFFAFEDVIQNQERSKYCSWFYRLKFPVQRPETPEIYPDYACFAYERMMPKLDTANREVQDYFCEVGAYWVREFDIDGWRLDVASEVDDGFWRAFRKAVKSVKPEALLIGEVWETARHWLQGDMFDSAMNYDLRKHCELFFARGSVDAFAFSGRITDMLLRYKLQITPAQLNLLDSHDVSRFLSLCGGDLQKYKSAVLFQLCFPGMPTIFYGDEQGIEGILEEEYRRPMPWEDGNGDLYQFFRSAIALRKTLLPLKRGNFRILSAEPDSRFLAFAREYENQIVTVYFNNDSTPHEIQETGSCLLSQNLRGNELIGGGFAIYSSCKP